MSQITVIVNGPSASNNVFGTPQAQYAFTYSSPASSDGTLDIDVGDYPRGVTIKYVMHAEIQGNPATRIKFHDPPIVWAKEPPNAKEWSPSVSGLDPYTLVLTDPCKNESSYGFFLQVDDGSGTPKKSSDPTIVNKGRPPFDPSA